MFYLFSLFKKQSTYSAYAKGKRTENVTYQSLLYYQNTGAKFISNLIIPSYQSNTTEVDLILICSKGIFVFECKNYSGWIFGNEAHKDWTQILPQGRGRCKKISFYNPIMQNEFHIRCLRNIIGRNVPMRSIIVFSDRGVLKDITINSENVSVINQCDLSYEIDEIYCQLPEIYSQVQINNIYEKLYAYTLNGEEAHAQHVENIKRKFM